VVFEDIQSQLPCGAYVRVTRLRVRREASGIGEPPLVGPSAGAADQPLGAGALGLHLPWVGLAAGSERGDRAGKLALRLGSEGEPRIAVRRHLALRYHALDYKVSTS
jgi:hypothetical protein